MGCGGSKPQLCTQEQLAELCTVAAKEMMVLCSKTAIENADAVEVQAPPEITGLRTDISRMRAYGKSDPDRDEAFGEDSGMPYAEQFTNDSQGGTKPKPKAKTKAKAKAKSKVVSKEEKGMISGMVGGVMDSAGSAATAAMATVLSGVADALQAVVTQVGEPFKKAGQDVLKENSEEIQKAVSLFVVQMAISNDTVIEMVRGKAPYGLGQLGAVPEGAVTQYLCTKCRAGLVEKLLPLCEESIKKHTVTSTWDSSIEQFNKLSEQVDKLNLELKLVPIQLDINDYIVNQIIEQLGTLMGKEETMHRSNPAGKSRHPVVFEDVFSGVVLDEATYAKLMPTE